MGTLVVDSSVLIAASNDRDPLHAHALKLAGRWPHLRALLPAVAYFEVMVEPMRTDRAGERDSQIREAGLEIVPVDAEIARVAAAARAKRRGLRLPDALVIATALVHEAELATLDRRMRDAHVALRRAV